MTETVQQAGDVADMLCNLKATIAALECQHKMNVLEEMALRKAKKVRPSPPMFMMIPLEQKKPCDDNSSIHEARTRRKGTKNHQKRDWDASSDSIASSECQQIINDRRYDDCDDYNGPKLRGGVLHNRCGCIYRDGLQDDCPLTECQAQPDCKTKPWATCRPGKFYRAQFPDIWPSPANDGATFDPCSL